jgi:prepilin-type N-terminal cleavage/methylation domain-containing protein
MQYAHKRGFSLIEMLVVIGIAMMLTSVMVIGMRAHTESVEVENQAYRLASAVREAQTNSISVKAQGNYKSFGVFFNTSDPTRVIFFGETSPNNRYDAGESIRDIRLDTGFLISALCGVTSGSGTCVPTNPVTVLFVRPFLNANIITAAGTFAYVEATVRSPKGKTRIVQIWTTGQVIVK